MNRNKKAAAPRGAAAPDRQESSLEAGAREQRRAGPRLPDAVPQRLVAWRRDHDGQHARGGAPARRFVRQVVAPRHLAREPVHDGPLPVQRLGLIDESVEGRDRGANTHVHMYTHSYPSLFLSHIRVCVRALFIDTCMGLFENVIESGQHT